MTRRIDPFVPPSPLDETEADILVLIGTGKKRGYVTYEELNTSEPELAPCPAMMDRILQTMDLERIEVIDGGDAKKRERLAAEARGEFADDDGSSRKESVLDLPITSEKIDDLGRY